MQALSVEDEQHAIAKSTPAPSLPAIAALPPPRYAKYAEMRDMRVPAVIIRSRMRTDGLDQAAQEAFFATGSNNKRINSAVAFTTHKGRRNANAKAMNVELSTKLENGVAARMSEQVMKANTLLPRNGQPIKRLRGRLVGPDSIVCSEPYELHEASRPGWWQVLCVRLR